MNASYVPPDYEIRQLLDAAADASMTGNRQILYLAVKRAMDIVFCGVGLILLSPLFLLVTIIIKLESRGPVFFIQKRCGKDGKLFGMIKFRSMVANAEEFQKDLIPFNEMDCTIFKMSNDARVTRLGKTLRRSSIDELPQLYNVLKGDMSLVGPRPLVMDEMQSDPCWRSIRLSVKPGITGLWQVEARCSRSFRDWVKYDVEYVKNRSLRLDVRLLLKTVKVVFQRKGAC